MDSSTSVTAEIDESLRDFLARSRFVTSGGVITDLDGTVVHEDRGRVVIPAPVELALKRLYDLGRPVVINSLRFPLSLIRTFGKEWYALSGSPIPAVSLNGSQLGYIRQNDDGELEFDEIDAFPLTSLEIEEVLKGVRGLLDGGVKDLLVFYYPRDWRQGEAIWTPVAERVHLIRNKYTSASSVTAVEFDKLREQLLGQDICMVFLLIDAPQDTLMAYQHTQRSNFFSHKGVDKLFGTRQIAARLGFDLDDSIGAGDTEMDKFLAGVGMAMIVGNLPVEFRGKLQTVRLRDSFELGAALFRLAELEMQASAAVRAPA